jgi:NRPS condensation-like uncharacterized protein
MSEAIPSTLPTRTEDIALHTMAKLSVPQIHMAMDFDGEVDHGRLQRALRLLMDAEPVLGCRFAPRLVSPRWERLTDPELDTCVTLPTTEGSAEELAAREATFLGEDLPAHEGPRLRALLLRGRPPGDRLLLAVHHQAADAGGVKELAYRLSDLYRALGDDPDHRPVPRLGSRSLRQVYRPLLPAALPGLLHRMGRDLIDAMLPLKHLQLPMGRDMGRDMVGAPRFERLQLSAERIARLRETTPEATINDLMCAAVFRALARVSEWNRRGALRIWGTVDLRRYLPGRRADGLCNLSGFMYLNLGRELGHSYTDTVIRVKETTDRIKGLWPGLGYPIGSWLSFAPMPLGLIDASADLVRMCLLPWMPPVLTNMGAIDDELLDFGDVSLHAAHLIVPTSHPPGLIMGLSGYRGSITFSAGHFPSALPSETLAALFQAIDDELPA